MKQRNKNLITYIVPTVFGQICFFLFTIIDGIFVGRGVGETALGAVNLCLPFVMVVNAFYMLITIGSVSVAAIRLGRHDDGGADDAFMHAFGFMLILGSVLTVVSVPFPGAVAKLLGATETYYGYVSDYLFWYSIFIIPASLNTLFQAFCRTDGSPMLVMAATVVSSLMNIFLDWLFVFPLKMGVAGAAAATGISQAIAFLIVLSHFILKKGELRFRKCRFQMALIGKIILRGLPEAVSQFAMPVATISMNYVLLARVGEIGENAYSVIGYVASFSLAIFMGVSEGIQPMVGHTYGEKNEKDLKFYFYSSLIINLIGSLLVYAALLIVGAPVCRLFGVTGDTLAFTLRVMPKYSLGFVIMALNTIISMYLYSTKRTKEALTLNILRGIVFTSAVILLMPVIFGNDAIWYAFVVYETLSLILAIMLVWISERKGIVFH
ncbi:MAG: MATE family efflux transporter [Eubacteriales bacterium]|nr:MATE family efflux transporter [Eubacteriales bacterium]